MAAAHSLSATKSSSSSSSSTTTTTTTHNTSAIKFPVTLPNPNTLLSTIDSARSTSKHTLLNSTATENFPHVPSDIDIIVDGVTFPLHRFPLFSRSERIRKLVEGLIRHGHQDEDDDNLLEYSRHSYGIDDAVVVLELPDLPGGPDAFELASKFCYGIDFEVSPSNIAQLRCAAEYLEMKDRSVMSSNLISVSDSLLEKIISESVEKSVQVLRACEGILPWAEEAKIVNRCIDAIASKACANKDLASLSKVISSTRRRLFINELEYMGLATSPLLHDLQMQDGLKHISPLYDSNSAAIVEWWAEDVSSLRVDIYQRVLSAMKSRGLSMESLAGSLMHYAQIKLHMTNPRIKPRRKKSPHPDADQAGLCAGSRYIKDMNSNKVSKAALLEAHHEQRVIIETLLSMFPEEEKNLFPTKFLLHLLRMAITLDTTVACQLDLERRIGGQLEEASVDDLLVPTYKSPTSGESMFDVEVIRRVLATYLHQYDELSRQDNRQLGPSNATTLVVKDQNYVVESLNGAHGVLRGLLKVAKLIDSYLAEIAPDTNLKASQIISLAEMLPDRSRIIDDHLYRAVDIFLKMHPTLPEMERKKVCRVVDCQKLSVDARKHAVENKRLPVEMVVQVLYFEQVRTQKLGPNNKTNNNNKPQLPLALLMEETNNVNDSTESSANHIDMELMLKQHGQGTQASRVSNTRELKEVVERLRDRIKELEKQNNELKHELVAVQNAIQIQDTTTNSSTTSSGTSKGGKRFFSHLFRLGKMNLFTSATPPESKVSLSPKARQRQGQFDVAKTTPRRRRHSLS